MKNRILILFAHPRFEKSVNQKLLVGSIPAIPEITFNDLYENYPDFNIDIENEKRLLGEHDIVIFQHPFYWYSSPALLKQWIDMVLEFGWAYGPGGDALRGKVLLCAITTGGQRTAYSREGHNRFTIRELLAPVEQTANLCKMIWVPPFTIHGTHRIPEDELLEKTAMYGSMLHLLSQGGFETEEMRKFDTLNEWFDSHKNRMN